MSKRSAWFELLLTNEGTLHARSFLGEVTSELSPSLKRKLKKRAFFERRTTIEFGHQLFDALFPLEINSHFISASDVAYQQKTRLSILFNIHDPFLRTLSLEELYIKNTLSFMACSREYVLARYIPANRRSAEPGTLEKLSLLVVSSSPRELPALNTCREIELIKSAINERKYKNINISVLNNASISSLAGALNHSDCNIVHFIGHGKIAHGSGYLALETPNGRTDWIDDQRLAHLLAGMNSLELVVLNSCQGSYASSHKALTGLAPFLVAKGVPSAVCMNAEMPDNVAVTFSETFWPGLISNLTVGEALQEARNALLVRYGYVSPFFGIPVLFSRDYRMRAFALEEKSATGLLAQTVHCELKPIRFIPFDLGFPLPAATTAILESSPAFDISLRSHLRRTPGYRCSIVRDQITVHMFEEGICVAEVRPSPCITPISKTSLIECLRNRRHIHLEFLHGRSTLYDKMRDVRMRLTDLLQQQPRRNSALSTWNWNGFLYVMSIYFMALDPKYFVREDVRGFVCGLVEPGSCGLHDLPTVTLPCDDINLSIEEIASHIEELALIVAPHQSAHLEKDAKFFATWANVVCLHRAGRADFIEVLSDLEIELQRAWFLAYLQQHESGGDAGDPLGLALEKSMRRLLSIDATEDTLRISLRKILIETSNLKEIAQ